MRKMFFILVVIFTLLLSFNVALANYSVFNVDYGQYGSVTVNDNNVYVSDIDITSNDVDLDNSIASYCVDMNTNLYKGSYYGELLPLNTINNYGNTYEDAANLVEYYAQPYDYDHDAAEGSLQVSIWETLYETESSYDLTSGSLNSTDPGVMFNIPNQDISDYSILHFVNLDGTDLGFQDVIVKTSPVPEPSTMLLFGTGILFGSVSLRRKLRRKK